MGDLKSKPLFLRILLIAVCLVAMAACGAPQRRLLEIETRRQLSAEDWKRREGAVLALMKIEDEGHKLDKETQRQITGLLNEETRLFKSFEDKLKVEGKNINQFMDARREHFPAGGYDDYIKIIAHHLAAGGVEGSLPAVFQLIAETNYAVTPAILISYGSKQLNFFIDKVSTGTVKERELALNTLSIWLDTSVESDDFDSRSFPSLNGSERKAVKPVIIKAVGDSDYNVRSAALSCLGKFMSDSDVRVLVEKMAESDTEQFIRKDARQILGSHMR